jgi:hypothetical protein
MVIRCRFSSQSLTTADWRIWLSAGRTMRDIAACDDRAATGALAASGNRDGLTAGDAGAGLPDKLVGNFRSSPAVRACEERGHPLKLPFSRSGNHAAAVILDGAGPLCINEPCPGIW